MGLYDRDYMREPDGPNDPYFRRLERAGFVRPRRLRGLAERPATSDVVESEFWPEFDGLRVPRRRPARPAPKRLPPALTGLLAALLLGCGAYLFWSWTTL